MRWRVLCISVSTSRVNLEGEMGGLLRRLEGEPRGLKEGLLRRLAAPRQVLFQVVPLAIGGGRSQETLRELNAGGCSARGYSRKVQTEHRYFLVLCERCNLDKGLLGCYGVMSVGSL